MKQDKRKGRKIKFNKKEILYFIQRNKYKKDLRKLVLDKFKITQVYYYKLKRKEINDINPIIIRIRFCISIEKELYVKFKKKTKEKGLRINDLAKKWFYEAMNIKNDLEFNKFIYKIHKGKDYIKNIRLELIKKPFKFLERHTLHFPVIFLPVFSFRPYKRFNKFK